MSVWTELLESAIHSPSPHNVQPWRIRIVNESEADLFIDSHRTLPKEDVTASFIILTMGLFIEALRLLAALRGLRLEHTEYHEPAWYAQHILKTREQVYFPLSRLRLIVDLNAKSEYDAPAFLKRRTSRIAMDSKQIPEAVTEELKQVARDSNQRYEQITNPDKIEAILQRNTDAVFEDLNNRDYHDEIVQWFRFTDKQAQETRDGLDYRCMNTSRVAYWLSARFPNLLEAPLTRPALRKVYRSQLGPVPTVGLLAGKFWAPEDAFAAGSFLMRFWLHTAKHDLYIHPFGNLVTNHGASAWLREATGIDGIWLVFKVGYSREPPKSYRRSVEEVLLA